MTHLLRHRRESNPLPLLIILVKGCDCLCYKLSLCSDVVPMLQPLVLLDKERNIILSAIDDTDIGLRVSFFAAN